MNADDDNAKIEMKRCSILNMHNSDARHSYNQVGQGQVENVYGLHHALDCLQS